MIRTAIILLGFSVVSTYAKQLPVCSGPNRAERKLTCIYDGDTGWEQGVKWRLIGIDAPEFGKRAECRAEGELSVLARDRLRQLMSNGYTMSGDKLDRNKRRLVKITLNDGRSVGKVLMEEKLAQAWPNSGNIWCGR